MPAYTGVHIDRALTNVSIFYRNASYIADEVSPPVQVRKESDKYFVYDRSHFRVPATFRADKDEASFIQYGVSDETYFCEEYALAIRVSDRERGNSDEPLRPDMDATECVTEVLLLDREIRVAGEVLDSTNYGSYAATHFANLTLDWDDIVGATPRQDIYHAKYAVWRDSRKQATHIILPVEVSYRLAQMEQIDELRKYTDPGLLTDSGLPKVLWGLKVLEAQATYDVSVEGATAESFSECWGTNVVVFHKNPGTIGIRTLTFSITMQSQPFQTRKWREENRKSDVMEVSHRYDTKIVAAPCAMVLTSTITPQT